VLAVVRTGIPAGSRVARRRKPVYATDQFASKPGLGASCMAGEGNARVAIVKTLSPARSTSNSLVTRATAVPGWPLPNAC
jgi:hypothetical protein